MNRFVEKGGEAVLGSMLVVSMIATVPFWLPFVLLLAWRDDGSEEMKAEYDRGVMEGKYQSLLNRVDASQVPPVFPQPPPVKKEIVSTCGNCKKTGTRVEVESGWCFDCLHPSA